MKKKTRNFRQPTIKAPLRKQPQIKRPSAPRGPKTVPSKASSGLALAIKSALPAAVLQVLPQPEANQITDLAKSIGRHGQLVPIVADHQGHIIDGRKRIEACHIAGVKPEIIRVKKGTNAAQRFRDLTLLRDHWSNGQRAIIGAAMANLGVGVNQHTKAMGITQEEAAKVLHTSADSIGRAKTLLASGRQDLVEQVVQKGGSLPQALRILKNEALIKKNREALGGETVRAKDSLAAMIKKGARYSVVYADPPWSYGEGKGSPQDPSLHYPLMSMAEIKSMDVKSLAAPNAECLMWVPNSLIPDGLDVLKAWGFRFVTTMVWCKEGSGPVSKAIALPHHETLLIGRRNGGVPMAKRAKVPKSFYFEDLGKNRVHSRKPKYFAEIIEKAFPKAAKIELFCRVPREGWTAWGNEAKVKSKAKAKPKPVVKTAAKGEVAVKVKVRTKAKSK